MDFTKKIALFGRLYRALWHTQKKMKWDGTRKNNFSILLTLKEEKKTFTQSLNYSSIEMEDEFNFGSLNYYTSYFVH